jgi:hypothetical protein
MPLPETKHSINAKRIDGKNIHPIGCFSEKLPSLIPVLVFIMNFGK